MALRISLSQANAASPLPILCRLNRSDKSLASPSQVFHTNTFHLQPTLPALATGMPPDWALLDLFVSPAYTNALTLYPPQPNTVGGLLNVNSGLAFVNNPKIPRVLPTQALLKASGNAALLPAVVATNIATMTLSASGGNNYTFPQYLSPGELAEIKGVADGGESSEANLQGMVDQATAQTGAVRVYCVGQALKQNPTATSFVVLSEQYRQAAVRGYNSSWTGNSTLLWKIVPP